MRLATAIAALLFMSLAANASYEDARREFKHGNFLDAGLLWTQSADEGDIQSKYQLGILLAVGKYLPQDMVRAKIYLEEASSAGNSDASFALAILYIHEHPDDPTQGIALLRAAAAQGSKRASTHLEIAKSINLAILGLDPLAIPQDQLPAIRFESRFVADSRSHDLGKAAVAAVCSACHVTGVAGAPLIGKARDWRTPLRPGLDEAAMRIIKGYKACPPRGGSPGLSDEQVRAAVYYMAHQP